MGAESAAAYAAMVQAIKASGVIVRLAPADFERLTGKMDSPLIVTCRRSFFGVRYQYLVGYKGLAFYTKSKEPIRLPGRAETIEAKTIWIPG